MKIAVLFDGAGLARLGLEQAGHECIGIELDPWKHYLSQFVGSGNCLLMDAKEFDLSYFDAVWASPPCQYYSSARTQGAPVSKYAEPLLEWALQIQSPILWVENVIPQGKLPDWGTAYNAAQFLDSPIQQRKRMIGGRYIKPHTYRGYQNHYPGVCPAITATEYKGCATDTRRASRFYGRRLTLEECAYHQGFTIPEEWLEVPKSWKGTRFSWTKNLYEAVGNGVPVYMSRAFGEAYKGQRIRTAFEGGMAG